LRADGDAAFLLLASTKHPELLVRATLKSVLKFCSLIAFRPFHASSNFNRQSDDRQPGFVFASIRPSIILRSWPCQPRIPAGRPPMPHRSLFYLLPPPPCSPPPLSPPRSLFDNKSPPSSSTLPDLR
jgi:hypothetical protein